MEEITVKKNNKCQSKLQNYVIINYINLKEKEKKKRNKELICRVYI